jgi:hypothetical protein
MRVAGLWKRRAGRVAGILALSVAAAGPAFGLTATEHLRAAPQPHFRPGHTLIPLTRWGWSLSYDTRVELAENWGYAVDLSNYVSTGLVASLSDTNSIDAKIVALAASDPKRYPLCVTTYRPLNDDAFVKTLPEATWCHDAKGALVTNAPQWKLWSPEAPDSVFKRVAELTVEPLRQLQKKAPIAIILNGGEYGLSVFGHSGPYWEKDPRVLKAKGKREWFDYVSERKAHQEMFITQAVQRQFPKRQLYLWYHFGGMPTWSSWDWSVDYKWMRDVSDMPDQSLYYMHYNTGWTGNGDLLTHALDAAAQCLVFGDRFSYNWLCAGWDAGGKFSDPERYMGFLKCLYTSGMLGGVAGYFSYPKPGFTEDLGPEIPSWLRQIMVLGHAQALFSHLEAFIRDGDLLPGPDKHRMAKDLPAYEFPTGHPDARVLARKHRQRREWLITAWTADGQERDVTVDIPGLGKATLHARPCGSVYRATAVDKLPYEPPAVELKLVDADGMFPSKDL